VSGSLSADRFADPGGRLTAAEADALKEELRALAEAGRSAYVVVVPDGDLRGWRQSWDTLQLRDDRDLLLLVSPGRWEARGWGLDPAELSRILDGSEAALDRGLLAGVSTALAALDGAGAAPVETGAASVEWLAPVGLASVLALSGLGWVLARRMRVQREQRAEVGAARRSLEDAVAHLVISAEALGDGGRDLQLRAVRLRDELRRVPAGEPSYLQVARIHRLEDEVVTLQSAVLAHRPSPKTETGVRRPPRIPEEER
jgi:hypothetical protein